MLFAVLAAALAPPLVVVTPADPPAIACPMVDVGSTDAVVARCESDKAARALVVQGASPAPRRGSGPVGMPEATRIRLDTVALYGPEDQRAVTLSVETTPERAAADLVILREVASKVEAYPTWRSREY
jgi:hypothetical protein